MNGTLGIILLIVIIAMLIRTGLDYTKKELVIDAGPIQVSAVEKSLSISRSMPAEYW